MSNALVAVISAPLVFSFLTVLKGQRAHQWGVLALALNALATVGLAWQVTHDGVQTVAVGGWGAGLGIVLYADGLAVVMVLMSALVMLGAGVYALRYFPDAVSRTHFWPLWLLLATALNALFVSGDLFNIYVTLELLGLSAATLAALGGERAALVAALRYLLVGLVGSMLYLADIGLLYAGYGSLDVRQVAAALQPEPLAWVAVLLMLIGLMLKMALYPLHFWLPPAHSNAPAPVSAVLSALVVKAAFYLVLRFWLDLLQPAVRDCGLADVLGMLGALAVLVGSWSAMRAERLKLLAAYSTVAQLGYLMLFLPLLAVADGASREILLGAMVLFALTHAFSKSALFLVAGTLLHHAGHDRIRELEGMVQQLPVATFVVALSGIALIGLPPSGTFIAKWHLLVAAFASGQWWWALVIAAGTLLASVYVFRLLGYAFGHSPAAQVSAVSLLREAPALLLALAATFGLGLGAAGIWAWLGIRVVEGG